MGDKVGCYISLFVFRRMYVVYFNSLCYEGGNENFDENYTDMI